MTKEHSGEQMATHAKVNTGFVLRHKGSGLYVNIKHVSTHAGSRGVFSWVTYLEDATLNPYIRPLIDSEDKADLERVYIKETITREVVQSNG